MPKKDKQYSWTKFAVDTIQDALTEANSIVQDKVQNEFKLIYSHMRVTVTADEVWHLDSLDEFFAEYRRDILNAHLELMFNNARKVVVSFAYPHSFVEVRLDDRALVEKVFNIFERGVVAGRIEQPQVPALPKPVPQIFIGHGRSAVWRDLRDHLVDQHGYTVEAFETSPRAGFTAKEVLDSMLQRASFAILVHTAEDEQADGQLRARQNVIHETGLFQGKLGFRRAIIVRQDACEEFSNVAGVQEVRYSNTISETFGDTLATLRRELDQI